MYDQCNNSYADKTEKKILMLSSSVVCFSFTILNIFENEKGIIKILVYSSVIDINQMEGIFATIITGS